MLANTWGSCIFYTVRAPCSDKYSMSQCLSVSLHVMSESHSTPQLSLFLLPLMPSLPGPVLLFLPSLLFIAKLPSCCPFLACVVHPHANVAPFLLSAAPTTLIEWDREWKTITIALQLLAWVGELLSSFQPFCQRPFSNRKLRHML